MAESAHITTLPVELRQKIAGLCRMRDLVALGRTCRTFQEICDDIYTIQESCFNNASDPTSVTVPTKAALRKLVSDDLESRGSDLAKSVWSLLALATSEMPALIDELEELLSCAQTIPWNRTDQAPDVLSDPRSRRRATNIVGALGSLTVLGNTTVCEFYATAALTGPAFLLLEATAGASGRTESGELLLDDKSASLQTTLPFCLAVGMLQARTLNNMQVLSSRLEFLAVQDFDAWWTFLADDFECGQAVGLLAIACVAWALESNAGVARRLDLADPSRLPFLNVLENGGHIPLPYGGAPFQRAFLLAEHGTSSAALDNFGLEWSWTLWLRSNVDALIDDIGRGEWVGYYTVALGRGDGHVDDPLTNVFFSTKETRDPDTGTSQVDISARHGVDGVGTFTLAGSVDRSTGTAILTKQYFGGETHGWDQFLIMTPLGLIGYWGIDWLRTVPMGYVWMYKREWARHGAFSHVGNRTGPPRRND